MKYTNTASNLSQTNLQKESKQISLYALETSTFRSVIFSYANTYIEKGLSLLVEDLTFGVESQISQENLGGLVGVGRQHMNEGLGILKDLGFLAWKRKRFGANVYSLTSVWSNPRFLKLIGQILPSLKRICKKLLEDLSTFQATPSKIEDVSLSSYRKLYKIKELLGGIKETGDIVNRTADEKRREIEEKREDPTKTGEFLQEDSVHTSLNCSGGTPRKELKVNCTPEQRRRMEELAEKALPGSAWYVRIV